MKGNTDLNTKLFNTLNQSSVQKLAIVMEKQEISPLRPVAV